MVSEIPMRHPYLGHSVYYKRLKTEESFKEYKDLRNFVNTCIEAEKKAFLQHTFKSDPKLFWKSLKSSNIVKDSRGSACDIDPYSFNDYFLNSVPNLPLPNDHHLNKYNTKYPDLEKTFQLNNVTRRDVELALGKIKTHAKGSDDINLKMLDLLFPSLTPFLVHIINTCFKKGSFPKAWKDANVIPIPKIDNPDNITQFRPISILPTISKVIERLVSDQLTYYLTENKILSEIQSGFRKNHSTTTALLKVTDDIFKSIDERKNTCLILLDFSKAFDTLDHGILLKELKYFGLDDTSVSFFQNYLSERRQRVVIGDKQSSYETISRGVPQGSILGPLLFSVYTADFASFLKNCQSHQYADDTQLYISFSLSESFLASVAINEDLKVIASVSESHKLLLNESKTELMIFGNNSEEISTDPNYEIKLNGKKLNIVKHCRNLGLYLDSTLRFEQHVAHLVKHSYYTLKLLYMKRLYLTNDIKWTLCDSLILSRLAYCSEIYWPSLLAKDKYTLQKIQNSCIRYSYGLRKYDHISRTYKDMKILNLEEKFTIRLAGLVYRINQHETPAYLVNKLKKLGDFHHCPTRSRELFNMIYKFYLYYLPTL